MEASADAHTFLLDFVDPESIPPGTENRIGGTYVLAHLERQGPASVKAMLAAALQRGHLSPHSAAVDLLPVATVVVMSDGCESRESWDVPTREALAWWIKAVDFRSVSRERYFEAFPRVDDGRDRNEEWKSAVESLRDHTGEA